MLPVELISSLIVLAFLFQQYRQGALGRMMADFLPIMAAAWVAEDSCIRVYGYYHYQPTWHGFIDQVPFMILLIWPVVILSGRDLVKRLVSPHGGGSVAALALCVTLDAALIEPIAVGAGLWSWQAPGVFGVPAIGILGWGLFAAGCGAVGVLTAGVARWSVLFVAPLATHVGLVFLWWAGFRFVAAARVPDLVAVAFAWGLLTGLALAIWRIRHLVGLVLAEIWPRGLAAAFFFVLLIMTGGVEPLLALYALAFTLPYLAALMPFRIPTGADPMASPP